MPMGCKNLQVGTTSNQKAVATLDTAHYFSLAQLLIGTKIGANNLHENDQSQWLFYFSVGTVLNLLKNESLLAKHQ